MQTAKQPAPPKTARVGKSPFEENPRPIAGTLKQQSSPRYVAASDGRKATVTAKPEQPATAPEDQASTLHRAAALQTSLTKASQQHKERRSSSDDTAAVALYTMLLVDCETKAKVLTSSERIARAKIQAMWLHDVQAAALKV